MADDLIPYAHLARLTRRLAGEAGVTVRVVPLSPRDAFIRYGAVRGRRTVMYAPFAPIEVVAHELAHVVTPLDEPEHGARWALNHAVILARLKEIAGSVDG